ncbi:MAG: hypothetical protein IM577_09735 [Chitinophagaceae bacterium]|nr:hypothetical protein [Chitinophagaceae bacterium]
MTHMSKLFFLLSLCIFFSACSKSDTNAQVNDDYYVKYKVESSTIYSGGKLDVQLSGENSTLPLVINQKQTWETTIGPVKKGFQANLKVTKQGWDGQTVENHLKLYLRIELSKNNGPFAMKQLNGSETPRATAEIKYTVE